MKIADSIFAKYVKAFVILTGASRRASGCDMAFLECMSFIGKELTR